MGTARIDATATIQNLPNSGEPHAADAVAFGAGGDHLKAKIQDGPTSGKVGIPGVGISGMTITLDYEAFDAVKDGALDMSDMTDDIESLLAQRSAAAAAGGMAGLLAGTPSSII